MGSFLETSIDPNGFRKTGRETPGWSFSAMCASRSSTKPFRWNLRRVNCDIIRTHPFELVERNKI